MKITTSLLRLYKKCGRKYPKGSVLFLEGEDGDEMFIILKGRIEISKAFGISYINVKRNVAKLRKEGAEVFFKAARGRSAHVLTPELIEKAQRLLYKGYNATEVGKRLNIKAPTIRKAIQADRLKRKKNVKRS